MLKMDYDFAFISIETSSPPLTLPPLSIYHRRSSTCQLHFRQDSSFDIEKWVHFLLLNSHSARCDCSGRVVCAGHINCIVEQHHHENQICQTNCTLTRCAGTTASRLSPASTQAFTRFPLQLLCNWTTHMHILHLPTAFSAY